MFALQGIISVEDQQNIENGLLKIKDEIELGKFKWKIEHEDVHIAIESGENNFDKMTIVQRIKVVDTLIDEYIRPMLVKGRKWMRILEFYLYRTLL
jgi:hypothetical protein